MPDPRTAVRRALRGIQLHQLEGFYHVARHGGFTRAADAMRYPITEPALHQQVRKLEARLGVALLVRGSGRRLVLTSEGRALFEFVAPYFERLPPLLRDLVGGAAGVLVVAAEPLFVEGPVSEALAAVQRHSPRAELRLLELGAPEIVRRLPTGDADVGIANLPEPVDGLTYEVLGHLGLDLLVPTNHRLARAARPLRPDRLSGERFIVYVAGSPGRAFTDEALRRAGIELTVAAEASSAQAMRALVRDGLGPAFVPVLPRTGRARRRASSDGVVAIDMTDSLRRVAPLPSFGLLSRRTPPPGGLAALFMAAVRSHFAAPSGA